MAQSSTSQIKVGIVGGTGYTGVELLRLLSQHPNAKLQAITSRSEDGMPVAQMFPNLRGKVDLKFQTPEQAGLESSDREVMACNFALGCCDNRRNNSTPV